MDRRAPYAGHTHTAGRTALAVAALLSSACGSCGQDNSGSRDGRPANPPAVASASAVAPASTDSLVVYKSPTCGCCEKWVQHMRDAGFRVIVHDTVDATPIKTKAGVTEHLASCHTAFVGGYTVEGHVPATDVQRLLRERPAIAGLAAPGMPSSAPGMDMGHRPYEVRAFRADGSSELYATHQ